MRLYKPSYVFLTSRFSFLTLGDRFNISNGERAYVYSHRDLSLTLICFFLSHFTFCGVGPTSYKDVICCRFGEEIA